MEGEDLYKKAVNNFPFNSIGHITIQVEPIGLASDIDVGKAFFDEHPDIDSVPVESDRGVMGLLRREDIRKARSALDMLRTITLEKFVDSQAMRFDAEMDCNLVLNKILENPGDKPFGDFLIFWNRSFFGIGRFMDLAKRIALARAMDLKRAKRLQEYLMTRNTISGSSILVEKFVRMANELGGDFYQEIKVRDNLYMIANFNVSGKNVAASLVTSLISSFFATLKVNNSLANSNPEKIVDSLNEVITDQTPEDVFIAAALLFVDMEKRETKTFNCGYSPVYAFYLDSDEKCKCKVAPPNLPPLGIGPYEGQEKTIKAIPILNDMKLFFYSDGLLKMKNTLGDNYGEERLKQFLFPRAKFTAPQIFKYLGKEIDTFKGDAVQTDDISVAIVYFDTRLKVMQ